MESLAQIPINFANIISIADKTFGVELVPRSALLRTWTGLEFASPWCAITRRHWH